MSRDLLLALLGQTYLEPFAFDDDDSDDDTDDSEDEPDDADNSDDDKDDGKKDDKKQSDKRSNRDSPESLKKQVSDLQKKLAGKNKRVAELARERASLNRQLKGGSKGQKRGDGDDEPDDSEVATLRRTVGELTDRLDNLSSENFIEKNVIRKLQPLVAAGLEEDDANRKLNAAMKLVDSDEDFDDNGNFDAAGFMERHPYLAVEAKEETTRERLIGGSGKKSSSKRNYAAEALERFNNQAAGKKGK